MIYMLPKLCGRVICITLLSSPPTFSLESFKNSNLFEDIAKYVFWTFNEGYRLQIMEHLSGFSDVELQGCQNLLHNNFIPYEGIGEDNSDEELVWCTVKNNNLKGDQKFALMYRKDKENRQAILNRLIKGLNCWLPIKLKKFLLKPFQQLIKILKGCLAF